MKYILGVLKVSHEKNLFVWFLLLALVALSGCYTVTFFKPSAPGATHPRTSCPGREEYLELERNDLRFTVFATTTSENFFIFILVENVHTAFTEYLNKPVKINLSDLVLIDPTSSQQYKPTKFVLLRASQSLFTSLDEFPIDPMFTFEGQSTYIKVGFPKDIEDRSRLVLTFPELKVGEQSIQFPDIEFNKTKEIRAFVINC